MGSTRASEDSGGAGAQNGKNEMAGWSCTCDGMRADGGPVRWMATRGLDCDSFYGSEAWIAFRARRIWAGHPRCMGRKRWVVLRVVGTKIPACWIAVRRG
jgi:hypothetical protein